jgi:hypothetical protein
MSMENTLPPSSHAAPARPGRSASARRRSAWRASAWAGTLVFLTAGYFQNTRPGWNVNSQFALACALAERGTFQIDAYVTQPEFETGDKALYGGHVYTDKSPVTAMLGAPVAWLARATSQWLGFPVNYAWARWLTTWIVIGGAAGLLTAMLTMLLAARGVEPAWAARGATLWVAATPLMPYSILFFNYLPACAFLLAGFALVAPAWRGRVGTMGPWRWPWRWLGGGLAAGLAAWTLNTLALPAMALAVALALVAAAAPAKGRARDAAGRGRLVGRLVLWAVGGLIGVAGYFIYNRVIFGAFGSPYAYEDNPLFREQMAKGFMGAGWPRLRVLNLLTLHPFMGLFVLFPLTALATAGHAWLMARGGRSDRIESGVALTTLAGLLLYVSGYFMWWGGTAYAPRHLIPALPLLGLGLAPWLRGRGWTRGTLIVVGAIWAVVNVTALAVDPQPPTGLLEPELMQADLSSGVWHSPMATVLWYFWKGNYADANWGNALGLTRRASLLPLAALWAAAWLALPKLARIRAFSEKTWPPAKQIEKIF